MRSLALAVFVSAMTAAPIAAAQPVHACPPGEAVQSLEAGGKIGQCIPVPAPVDLGAVNARIDAEAVARMQADQELRDSVTETGLSGRFAVIGTTTCVRSSLGFGPGPQFIPVFGGTVQIQSVSLSGIRSFNSGTGTLVSTNNSITHPAPLPSGGMITGVATPVDVDESFDYTVDADRTIRITTTSTNNFALTSAGRVPTVTVGGAARVGKISKDWKTITLASEELKVETVTTGTGAPLDRVCSRVETLHKLAD